MSNNKAAVLHNPFNTFTNYVYPKTMKDVFEWAKWFWNRHHKYRTAIQKVVTYFVAGLNVTTQGADQNIDPDAITKTKQLLQDVYDILPLTVKAGQQLASMGNVFISAQRVFTRDLLCTKCGFSAAIDKMVKDKDYKWNAGKFTGYCPHCKKWLPFNMKDVPSVLPDGRKLRFVFRSAEDMRIKYNSLTGQYIYMYQLPAHIKEGILSGDQIYLRSTPQLYIKAALSGNLVQFDRTRFFSMRTETLSQLDNLYRGWGVPLFLASFGNLMRLAMLDRFNEAVVMEYIAPLRMISPPADMMRAGSDPNRNPISGNFFKGVMSQALKNSTTNPTTWVVSPFPVNYTMLGGQAKQMAPVDLMEWYVTQILSDMGIPQQFKQTTFQVAAPSMGLRVFQRMWIHFAKDLNKFVKWFSDIVCQVQRTQHLKVDLNMTSFVQDDLNRQVRLQLMQGGVISRQQGLAPFGIDYKQDAKKRRQEQASDIEHQQQMDADMQGQQMTNSVLPPGGSVGIDQAQANIEAAQQAAQGGAPQGAAGPMPPAGGAMPQMPFNQGASQSATMQGLFSQAQQQAQQIYNIGVTMGPAARRKAIADLRANDKIMHAQVMSILQGMDRNVASQAVAQSKGTMR